MLLLLQLARLLPLRRPRLLSDRLINLQTERAWLAGRALFVCAEFMEKTDLPTASAVASVITQDQ
jgi:hypothetical protein